MSQVDWQAIRAEYESSVSLRHLAAKYGVGKSTIAERAWKEHWIVPRREKGHRTPDTGHRTPDRTAPPTPLPADATTIARIGLQQLARHLQSDEMLPISAHKSLSDALAQYVKVLVTAPHEEESVRGVFIDLSKLPAWKRMELRRLLAADDAPEGEAV